MIIDNKGIIIQDLSDNKGKRSSNNLIKLTSWKEDKRKSIYLI